MDIYLIQNIWIILWSPWRLYTAFPTSTEMIVSVEEIQTHIFTRTKILALVMLLLSLCVHSSQVTLSFSHWIRAQEACTLPPPPLSLPSPLTPRCLRHRRHHAPPLPPCCRGSATSVSDELVSQPACEILIKSIKIYTQVTVAASHWPRAPLWQIHWCAKSRVQVDW